VSHPLAHLTTLPVSGRPGTAAGVLAARSAGQRAGRCPLRKRPYRQVPGASGGKGQLEHPRHGASGRSARSFAAALREALQEKKRSNCADSGSKTMRPLTVDVTVRALQSHGRSRAPS